MKWYFGIWNGKEIWNGSMEYGIRIEIWNGNWNMK